MSVVDFEKVIIVSSYKDIWKSLDENQPFRLSSEDLGSKFSMTKVADFFPDHQLSLDQVKIIFDEVCRYGRIKEFEISVLDFFLEGVDGLSDDQVKWLEEMISNISVDYLKLLSCGDLPNSNDITKSIGEALEKNKNIQILDLYGGSQNSSLYTPIFDGISRNSSIKILSIPPLQYYNESFAGDQANIEENPQFLALLSMFSAHQPCQLQVLDLGGYIISEDFDLDFLGKVCRVLESNTSIHTLVTYTYTHNISFHSSVFDIVSRMLDHNFTLQHYGRADKWVGDHLPVMNDVLKKLKRNKKLYLSHRSIDYYLLLFKLTKSSNIEFPINFPCELRGVIFDFYLSLLFSKIPNETYLPYIDFQDDAVYPFSTKDIF